MANQSVASEQVGERIWLIGNRLHRSNTYICATGEGGDCFLVDPGTDVETIDAAIVTLGLAPRQVFCTHGHFDHVGSASYFQEKYGARCYLHSADEKAMRSSNFLLMAFRIPFAMKLPVTDPLEGFVLHLGGRELRAIHSPGHTPGSCILQYGDALFTGDTIYTDGIGLSKLPLADPALLKSTIMGLWDTFPAHSQVFPGHGVCGELSAIKIGNRPLLEFLGLGSVSGGGA